MLHPDLVIETAPGFGEEITNEQEIIDYLLEEDHVCFAIGDIAMEVEFSPDRAAFIGWVDSYNDIIFYYDNGSGNHEPVDLTINCCPEERFMCYEPEVIRDIILHFCRTGERNPKYSWAEDEMEG